ncbi:MAG: LD-carboxypeptidase [Cyanophyceae cyanobacterium]
MIKLKSLQLPPPLQPGDLVRVIAPSGALRESEVIEHSLEIWRSRGYQVLLDDFPAPWGYLAGDDFYRRQALAQAWQDPECRVLLCARGGYGSARLLEDWSLNNWQGVNPKWLVGFSDITGLLWSLAQAGIASIHGPVLTTFAVEPQWSIERLFDCVEGRPLKTLMGQGWGGGQAQGWLLPANLTVATHCLGTSIVPSLEGAILALEDVQEAPYRIDRLLTQWRLSGAFTGVRGMALGRFSRCEPAVGYPSWNVSEVLRDRLGDLNIPIVSELPFGHDGANAALRVGQKVMLDAEAGTLNFS